MKIKPRLKEDLKKFLLLKLGEESKIVTLISSHKLTNEQIEDIKERFPRIKNKEIILEINEKLMAGFILKEGSKITDFSLKSNLNNIKKNIYELA
ncbi:MAG: F0F1 ATP synthase subunit delta [bacterium]|nr:F0F1 ATP synthase subunit delta [bacterium]